MEPLLDIERVSRSFGHRAAVADASLRLEAGRSLCLVGRNGAGKSTLLAVAAGALAADSGRVKVLGRDVADEPAVRRQIGYMSDSPQLYEALSGRENLSFYARLYGLGDAKERTDQLLETVGLSRRAGDAAGGYSAGMRRRLDLARVMLHRPRLLLLDEPGASLDRDGRDILSRVIAEHCQDGRAVLLTAHESADASDLADTFAVIEDGRLVGSSDEAAGGEGGPA